MSKISDSSVNRESRRYKAYGLHNFRDIVQVQRLSQEQLFSMEVVSHVLPFKANNYV